MLSWIGSWMKSSKLNKNLNIPTLTSEQIQLCLHKFKYLDDDDRNNFLKSCNIADDSISQSIWTTTGLQFDLTQNTSIEFENALNNPFFIGKGIIIQCLCIYTILYLSEKEKTWDDSYNDELCKFIQNPNNILKYFNLNCWALTDKNMCQLSKSLAYNTNLRELVLSENGIGDSSLSHLSLYLSGNKTLTKLDLSNNKISDIGLTYLSQGLELNRTLKNLNLSYNGIFNKLSLEKLESALKSNHILKDLLLSHIIIGEYGIIHIANIIKNNTLRHLDLSHCLFDINGALEISKALETCNSLDALDLSHNKIRDEGCIYIANALIKNVGINELYLNLKNNEIGDKGAIALSNVLIKPIIWCMYLDNNNITNIGGISMATSLSKREGTNNDYLFFMSLRNNVKIGTNTMEMFRKLSSDKMNTTFFQFWVAFYDTLPVISPF